MEAQKRGRGNRPTLAESAGSDGILLAEVALQQALQSLAVTGLVASHLLVTSLPLVTKV